MHRPKIDDEVTLLGEFGEVETICAEVGEDQRHPGGILLKVMARGPFEQGQQCWILDPDGSKTGARVENVTHITADSEVTLSAILD